MSNLEEISEPTKRVHSTATGSAELVDEALKKASVDITQTIRDEVKDSEGKSIKRACMSFVKEQFGIASRGVLAMLFAAALAMIMPFLVKLELVDDFNRLSDSLTSAMESHQPEKIFQSTVAISEKTEVIEQQNSRMMLAFSQVEKLLHDMRAETEGANTGAFQTEVAELLLNQSDKLDLLFKQNELSSIDKKPDHYASPIRLKNKITEYIARGQQLKTRLDNGKKDAANAWISEVYFFLGVIPESSLDLREAKVILKSIYVSEKPYVDEAMRVSQTLLLLNAIRNWVTL